MKIVVLKMTSASGILQGTAGDEFFLLVTNPPRGRPFGGVGIHRNRILVW